MKSIFYYILCFFSLVACNTTKNKTVTEEKLSITVNDTIKINNEELEYEVIIIESGFSNWLASQAKPEGFYSQHYL